MTDDTAPLTRSQILILAVVLLGCLSAFPLIAKARGVIDSPADLPLENLNDETYYLSYLMAAIRGEGSVGSLCFAEHDDQVQPKVAWAERLWGTLLSVPGPGLATAYWFSHALGVFMMTLTFSWLLRALGVGRWSSWCWGFLIISVVLSNYMFRAVHPGLSGTVFWGGFATLVWWWVRPGRLTACLLGAGLGVQFYNYPYYWAFFLLTCGLLLVFLFIDRDRPRWRTLVGGLAVGLAVGAVPLAGFREISAHPAYEGLLERLAYLNSDPVFSKSVLLWLLVAWYRRRSWPLGPVFLCGAVAALLATNQQILTGKHPSESRYIWFIVQPLLAMQLVGWGLARDLPRASRRSMPVGALIVACLFWAHGIHGHLHAPDQARETVLKGRSGQDLASWMSGRVDNQDVVACPLEVAPWLTLHGTCRVYASLHGNTQLLTQEEWSRRLHAIDWLSGMSPETYDDLLETEVSPRTSTHFLSRFHRGAGGYTNVPRDVLDGLRRSYRGYCLDSETRWSPRYRVDAILLPTGHDRETQLEGWRREAVWNGKLEFWVPVSS